MRVSSSQIYNIANIGMRDAQVAVDKTNQQISSGKRVLSPADDPVAATAILMLNQELARTSQYSKNIDAADNNLALEDTTLQSVMNLMQRLKELAVRAGSTAVLTPSDYKSIAAEVDSRLSELMNLQNTRNASGQYIFAGFQSETQPFVTNGGGNYSFKGDEGQLYLQASSSVTVAVGDSGKKIFMDIPAGHNTFNTAPISSNISSAVISVGNVYDQTEFDKLYPKDMLVTFNANSAIAPPAQNFTITERSTGKILIDKQLYVSGQEIKIAGASFNITGIPYAGTAAVPATVPMGAFAATNFTAGGVGSRTLEVSIGGVTETLTLDQDISSVADLVSQLGGNATYPNSNPVSSSPSANANHAKLLNLGITFDAAGFHSTSGLNITVKNGASEIDAMTNMVTTGAGSKSPNIPFTVPAGTIPFSTTPQTVDITVNGKTEKLVLNTDVSDAATLAAALNTPANAAALAKLGVVATPLGLTSSTNSVISLTNAGANVLTAIGVSGSPVTSSSGILATPGDKFVIESTDKQALLTTVSRFSEAMKLANTTQEGKDTLAKIIGQTLASLENSITNVSSVQGEVGARQNMLESTKDLNADISLNTKEILSQLEDLDYAEASTRLQMQTFVLSAAQQSFIRVSELSLFKYM